MSRPQKSAGRPPKYTEAEKEEAAEITAQLGPSAASRKTGIPKGTLSHWLRDYGKTSKGNEQTKKATSVRLAQLAAKREIVREMFLEETQHSLRLMEGQTDANERRNLAIAAGTTLDKFRLESGESTSREEHIDAADAKRKIQQRLAGRLKRERTQSDTGDAD